MFYDNTCVLVFFTTILMLYSNICTFAFAFSAQYLFARVKQRCEPEPETAQSCGPNIGSITDARIQIQSNNAGNIKGK